MYKKDLALNNLEWLICHETQSNQNKVKRKQFTYHSAGWS